MRVVAADRVGNDELECGVRGAFLRFRRDSRFFESSIAFLRVFLPADYAGCPDNRVRLPVDYAGCLGDIVRLPYYAGCPGDRVHLPYYASCPNDRVRLPPSSVTYPIPFSSRGREPSSSGRGGGSASGTPAMLDFWRRYMFTRPKDLL
ncbi:hypothetical protein Taro_033355 [Colocasia esculenta]|uniref:Uncharacterized protein n=1 Tax=Colocasia esculenta TaxID=4460 RepID=A0A843WC99_COLES|nr:hypothetical protein [Colocasia esculenta]